MSSGATFGRQSWRNYELFVSVVKRLRVNSWVGWLIGRRNHKEPASGLHNFAVSGGYSPNIKTSKLPPVNAKRQACHWCFGNQLHACRRNVQANVPNERPGSNVDPVTGFESTTVGRWRSAVSRWPTGSDSTVHRTMTRKLSSSVSAATAFNSPRTVRPGTHYAVKMGICSITNVSRDWQRKRCNSLVKSWDSTGAWHHLCPICACSLICKHILYIVWIALYYKFLSSSVIVR